MLSNLVKLALIMCLTIGYGCATVINGTTQKIPVSSVPSGVSCSLAEHDHAL